MCELHRDVTTRITSCSSAARCCRECPDKVLDGVDPLILESDRFARSIPPYPADRYSGRGVVIVGGGKYWPSVWVTVRMLRDIGCTLPVQVWHLGPAEANDWIAHLLSGFDVDVIDALAHPEAAKTRGLTGFIDTTARHGSGSLHPPFQVKSFAALHSPFKEVLVLDADNYPCADPTVLFDEPRYLQTGAVFWPDRAETAEWTRWADWGVKPFGPHVGLEVGQYLVNKAKVWEPLSLMRWYDDRGDWCYGWGRHHDHGDKGPPRVAWAKFRREYTMYATHCNWDHVAFVQPGPDGVSPMFIHRCQSKFVLDETAFDSTPQLRPNMRLGFAGEETAFGFLDELRRLLT